MKKNLIMAWRNLWRNKRRTWITVASVFFGVLLSTVMSSMQEGSYSSMIDNIVKFYSGYIQIHQKDYWENKTINNAFAPSDSLMAAIRNVQEVTEVTPRLESFALASSEKITRGSMVIGVDPVRENKVTALKKWVTQGAYLQAEDDGVLVAADLAKFLHLDVGDTLVLLSQGYHGVSAAGKYPIRGILNFPSPDLNKQTVYMTLQNCQYLYNADKLVTALVLMVKDQYHLKEAMRTLKANMTSPYSVMSWSEMQPQLLQMVEADRAGAAIMKAILYILIGFGIFGTIMMMVAERRREMGVMIAIGMQRYKLAAVLFFETLYIGLIGVLAGFLGSIPIIAHFYTQPVHLTGDAAQTMVDMGIEPLLYFSWLPSIFYTQVAVVFAITTITAIYPFFAAHHLKVQLAIKG